jgi:hypothetical protein
VAAQLHLVLLALVETVFLEVALVLVTVHL